MRVDTALLCDAATVRDGLLHILGGGISQVERAEFPAELGVTLALRIMVHQTEAEDVHEVRIIVQGQDGEQVTEVRAQAQLGPPPEGLEASDEGAILLPWDFPGRPKLPHPGRYSMEVLIDGHHEASVPFKAVLVDTQTGEMS